MDKFVELSSMLDSGLRDLISTWDEIVSGIFWECKMIIINFLLRDWMMWLLWIEDGRSTGFSKTSSTKWSQKSKF